MNFATFLWLAATASPAFAQLAYGGVSERAVFAQTGEVTPSTALINARCNIEKPSDVRVSFAAASVRDSFPEAYVEGYAGSNSDYTTTLSISNLKADTKYEYRVTCTAQDGSVVANSNRVTFWTSPVPSTKKDVSFVWAADLAGQGWGRNPNLKITNHFNGKPVKSGFVIFEVMRALKPDFGVFQGDMIYADGRLPATVPIPATVGGGTWINEPALDLVAITLDDFRMKWKYNHGDNHIQDFLEEVPVYIQWDDHEVLNNWYPTEIVGPPNFPNGTRDSVLAGYSLTAFHEHNPIPADRPIYRSQQYGAHLELFFLDQRSYRGANDANEDPNGNNVELGTNQLAWLKQALLNSVATWKIISNDDPISIVTGGPGDWDTFGTGDPRLLGRELEFANLLQFIKDNNIQNVVFITSDVHFAASLYYEPSRATFNNFNGFYEFVIGPIGAGAFGPSRSIGTLGLDESFGASYEYLRDTVTENYTSVNLPPPFLQSFGQAVVSADGKLTVYIRDITGEPLYTKVLMPASFNPPVANTSKCNYFSLVTNGPQQQQVVVRLGNGSVFSGKQKYSIRFTPCNNNKDNAKRVTFEQNGVTLFVDTVPPFDAPSGALKLALDGTNNTLTARVYAGGRAGKGNLLLSTTSVTFAVTN